MSWRVVANVDGMAPLVATGPADGPLTAADLPQLTAVSWTDQLMAEDEAWPARQDVTTGQLQLVAATAAEVAGITATSPVSIDLYRPADAATPVASFHGRVGEPVIDVHELGVVVSMAITDYLADLAELTVGDDDYPAETAGERLDRLFDALELPHPEAGPALLPGPMWWWPQLTARAASAASALELILRTAHVVVQRYNVVTEGGSYYTGHLYAIRPNVDPATGRLAANPWRWEELPTEASTAPALKLTEGLDGVWRTELDPADPTTTALGVHADHIGYDASWTRAKGRNPNAVTVVKGNQRKVTVRLDTDAARVTYKLETELADNDDAARLALFLLPAGATRTPVYETGWTWGTTVPAPMDPISGWEAEGFDVLVDDTPDGWWSGQLRDAHTIAGIQPHHHPEAVDWWTGTLSSIGVAVSSGQLTAALKLEARPMTVSDDAISWAELDPTMTWAELDPTVTWQALANTRP